MKSQLKIELERAFINKKFVIVLLIEIAILLTHFIHIIYPAITTGIPFLKQYIGTKTDFIPGALYYWIGANNSIERTALFAILPILCAIPYGNSLYKDCNSKYYEKFIVREEKKNYYFSKLIVMFLNGGIVGAFPFVLSLYVNLLLLPIEQILPSQHYFSMCSDTIICANLFVAHPVLYCIVYMIFVFVGFGIINCLCFCFSYILTNSAVVLMSPFVIYFSSFVLMEFIGVIPVAWQFMRFNQLQKDDLLWVILQLALMMFIPILVALFKSRKQVDAL